MLLDDDQFILNNAQKLAIFYRKYQKDLKSAIGYIYRESDWPTEIVLIKEYDSNVKETDYGRNYLITIELTDIEKEFLEQQRIGCYKSHNLRNKLKNKQYKYILRTLTEVFLNHTMRIINTDNLDVDTLKLSRVLSLGPRTWH